MALTNPLIPCITLLDFFGALMKSSNELVTDELAQLSTYSGNESVSNSICGLFASAFELIAFAVRQQVIRCCGLEDHSFQR
jgi:hypothetical protein